MTDKGSSQSGFHIQSFELPLQYNNERGVWERGGRGKARGKR